MTAPTTQPSASTMEFETNEADRATMRDILERVGVSLMIGDSRRLLRDLDLAIRQRDEERKRADEAERLLAPAMHILRGNTVTLEAVASERDNLRTQFNIARTEAVNETVREIVEWLKEQDEKPFSDGSGEVFAEAIEARDFHKKTGEAG